MRRGVLSSGLDRSTSAKPPSTASIKRPDAPPRDERTRKGRISDGGLRLFIKRRPGGWSDRLTPIACAKQM